MNLEQILAPNNLKAYQKYLKTQKVSSSTIKRKLASLRKFNHFAKKHYLKKNIGVSNQSISNRIIIPATKGHSLRSDLSLASKRSDLVGKGTSLLDNLRSRLPTYINIAILVLFSTALGIFGYQQIIKEASITQAYPQANSPASPNRYFSFQARLTDSSDNPITTPTDVRFMIYDHNSASGSANLWEELRYIDPDQDGIFSVTLGTEDSIASDIFSENADLWLGVTVETDAEATPRQRIATVGYALNAETLQGFPPSASPSADQIPVLTQEGHLVLMAASPQVYSTSGTFGIKGQVLAITTDTGTNGDITISPDGTGQLLMNTSTTTEDSLYLSNANITTGSLIHGYIGNDNLNANLVRLGSGATEVEKFAVRSDGQTRITGNLVESTLIIDQLGSGDIFTASASGTTQLTLSNTGYLSAQRFTDLANTSYYLDPASTGTSLTVAGNIIIPGTTTFNSLEYTWPSSQTTNYVLSTNGSGALSWTDPASAVSSSIPWIENATDGTLYPKNSTLDLLIGGQATASANIHLQSNGTALFKNSTNSTTAFQVQQADTTPVFNVDTVNGRVGIKTIPSSVFEVAGTTGNISFGDDGNAINFSRDGANYITADGGSSSSWQLSAAGTTAMFIASAGRVSINNNSAIGQFNVFNGNSGRIAQMIRASAGQTANILEIQDSSSNVLSGVDERGILFSDGNIGDTNLLMGKDAGNISASGAINNTGIGTNALAALTNGDNNVAIGYFAGKTLTEGLRNVFIGTEAGEAMTTGDDSMFLGYRAGHLTTGISNTFIGRESGRDVTSGIRNTFIGGSSGRDSNASNSVALGYLSGLNAGSNSTMLGNQAGQTSTGIRNVFIGNYAGYNQAANTDLLILDNQERADIATEQSNSILYGVMAALPADQTLRINAQPSINGAYTLPIVDGTTNYVLTTNGSGTTSWGDPASAASSSIPWIENATNGTLYPKNSTLDVFFGGQASDSANFAFINNNDGTPTASISGNLTLNSTGEIQTTLNQTLTLGGDTTGNIYLNGDTNITGNLDISGTLTSGTADAFVVDASGNITSGTWTATAITADYGGTGLTSYTVGDLLYADGTTSLASLAGIATGNVLLSGGVGVAPSWGKITLGTHTTGNYVSSLTGTANQVTASASTGDVTLSLPSDLRAPGTLNAVSGIYTGATAGTERIDASGNLVNIGDITSTGTTTFNGVTYTWPGSQTTNYVLQTNGSGTLSWVAQSEGSTSYWRLSDGAISPTNDTLDVLFGSSASSSANFAFLNNNDGTPTASISGNLTLNSAGLIQTTLNQTLTLGGDTTGNIYLNGNLGIGTNSPEALLEIQGIEATDAILALDADDGDDANDTWFIKSEASDNDLSFIQDTTERFKIDSNGYIYTQRFVDSSSSTYYLDPAATGDSLIVAGNIGIGDTSPSSKLTFGTSTNATDGIDFGGDTTLYRSGANILKTDDSFNIGTVGIGTTNSVITRETSGLLSARDIDSRVWASGLVDGSGSTNYLPYFTDSNSLETSNIYYDRTNSSSRYGFNKPSVLAFGEASESISSDG